MPELARDRLAGAFQRGRGEERALLMPFLMCGYPDPERFLACVAAAVESGADVLEIGIPFSDPIMDGPVITAAATEVLARGLRTEQALDLLARAGEHGVPLVAMTYYNLVFRHGLERFAERVARAGGAGSIVPDLSLEDSDPWRKACASAGIAPVFIASQTSSPERLRALGRAGDGFVYAAALLGVTGVRTSLGDHARVLVEQVRAATPLPVAVGIGVSTAEQVAQVAAFADGVIVGSALVQRIGEASDPADATRAFVGELRRACER